MITNTTRMKHEHEHQHEHAPHRSLSTILAIIQAAPLPER